MISDTSAQEKADPSFDFTFAKKAQEISSKEFTDIKDFDSLYDFARKECALGQLYVGQILDAQTNELAHSFMLERTQDDEFTCSDKQGFKRYPFSVHELGTLLDFINKDGEKPYINQKWRFVDIT